jgi:hypothetical protein
MPRKDIRKNWKFFQRRKSAECQISTWHLNKYLKIKNSLISKQINKKINQKKFKALNIKHLKFKGKKFTSRNKFRESNNSSLEIKIWIPKNIRNQTDATTNKTDVPSIINNNSPTPIKTTWYNKKRLTNHQNRNNRNSILIVLLNFYLGSSQLKKYNHLLSPNPRKCNSPVQKIKDTLPKKYHSTFMTKLSTDNPIFKNVD